MTQNCAWSIVPKGVVADLSKNHLVNQIKKKNNSKVEQNLP